MRVDRAFPLSTDKPGLNWTHDPCRVTIDVLTDPYDTNPVGQLYQSVIELVDPELKLFADTLKDASTNSGINGDNRLKNDKSRMPSLAVMLFLRGSDSEENVENDDDLRLLRARHIFQHKPWRFHHAEKVSQGHMNALPRNSQDFYFLTPDLPLWAIRQVHYGREHVRYVLYTQEDSWLDQVQFYTLLIGLQPELLREDFCLFTLYANEDYDVQFALKKHCGEVKPLSDVHIQIKVKDIGQLVPLFPNVCRPVSDIRWETTDHDGNVIVLNLNKTKQEHILNKPASRKMSSPPAKEKQSTKHNFCSSEDSDFYSLTSSSEDFSITSDHHTYSNVSPKDYFDPSSKFVFESTCSDLDFDLPLPRRKKKDEDETSLTLTTTSEESGIQMTGSSDDTSYCEDESLKSCLSVSSKSRGIKLKVRFKEDVQTFEEDTLSQHSSGIDSDGQSDSEMETRFSFTPLATTQSQFESKTEMFDSPRNAQQRSCHTSDISRSNNNLLTPIQDKFSIRNQQFSSSHQQYKDTPVNNTNIITTTPFPTAHSNSGNSKSVNSKSVNSNIANDNKLKQCVNDKSFHPQSVNVGLCHNKSNHRQKNADGVNCIDLDTCRSRQLESPHTRASKISADTTNVGQERFRSPQRTSGQSQPPPPPVRDITTRLRSVSCSDQKPSNSLSVSKQIGQQKFYFEVPPTTGSSASEYKNKDSEEATLKFTLKYDTGLSSGQEQVGFYV